jgi:hypothetical protein
VVEPPDHLEVLEPGQVLVHRRVLPRQPDPRTHLRGVADDVEPGDARRALVRQQQRREDAHRRGLSCAVRPEEPEDASGLDAQIDPTERLHAAVALVQPRDLDGSFRLHRVHATGRLSARGGSHEPGSDIKTFAL